ncbi:hypothetical protein [uncultured Tenacibaculum sp.]|uniref:hypothetical protein n=1 Tax=uncultured Tenacibaculum sp. TaxID=174713 RepID=UPI002608ED16|nr:hypothetical protein [uncultured Tenacibaculum sp.]
MKRIASLFLFVMISTLIVGCAVEWETKFNKDGGGKYSMIIDMSAMIEMTSGMSSNKKKKENELKDTVIDFSKILETKKDSIAKLPIEEQKKLKELEDLKISIEADTATKKAVIRIDYDFDSLEDLKSVGEKIKMADLDEFVKLGNKKDRKSDQKVTEDEKDEKFPAITDMLNIEYTSSRFSTRMTEESVKEVKKNSGEDNPFASMIKFKMRYIFPYKIKSVSNEDVRILSSFKGIEFDASVSDLSKNPEYLNVDVEFEKE